jgi:hypothetical protein
MKRREERKITRRRRKDNLFAQWSSAEVLVYAAGRDSHKHFDTLIQRIPTNPQKINHGRVVVA